MIFFYLCDHELNAYGTVKLLSEYLVIYLVLGVKPRASLTLDKYSTTF